MAINKVVYGNNTLIDLTNTTVTADKIVSGTGAYGANGVWIDGTMLNNGAISGSIDGLVNTSYSVPSGYTSGGTVSLTSDIENALASI